jgi:hypothetical protein
MALTLWLTVVRRERDIGVGAEQLDGLVEIAGPQPWVPDQGTAQRQQVVQVVRGVLGHVLTQQSLQRRAIRRLTRQG